MRGLRKNFSRLVAMHRTVAEPTDSISYLQSEYLIGRVSLPGSIQTIKQSILAYSNKLRHYIAEFSSKQAVSK